MRTLLLLIQRGEYSGEPDGRLAMFLKEYYPGDLIHCPAWLFFPTADVDGTGLFDAQDSFDLRERIFNGKGPWSLGRGQAAPPHRYCGRLGVSDIVEYNTWGKFRIARERFPSRSPEDYMTNGSPRLEQFDEPEQIGMPPRAEFMRPIEQIDFPEGLPTL